MSRTWIVVAALVALVLFLAAPFGPVITGANKVTATVDKTAITSAITDGQAGLKKDLNDGFGGLGTQLKSGQEQTAKLLGDIKDALTNKPAAPAATPPATADSAPPNPPPPANPPPAAASPAASDSAVISALVDATAKSSRAEALAEAADANANQAQAAAQAVVTSLNTKADVDALATRVGTVEGVLSQDGQRLDLIEQKQAACPCTAPAPPPAPPPHPRPRPIVKHVPAPNMPTEYCQVCDMFKRGQGEYVAPPPPARNHSHVADDGAVCFWALNRVPTAMVLHDGPGPATPRSRGLVSWSIDPGAWQPSPYYPGFVTRQICMPAKVFAGHAVVSLCGDVGYQNFKAGSAVDELLRKRRIASSDPACIAGHQCPPNLR